MLHTVSFVWTDGDACTGAVPSPLPLHSATFQLPYYAADVVALQRDKHQSRLTAGGDVLGPLRVARQ
ncbi:protein of unknown function [Candidatus Filomicrobium marinum]|uniref:Uncharacterized protein n=1 Tax=Candidatus Filomicrobium marinum TaxID=1608628 RepID=A0A0D6JDV2_9HYPH|nr:protein of unknown function [Candidatus Filomicrobium marinum]